MTDKENIEKLRCQPLSWKIGCSFNVHFHSNMFTYSYTSGFFMLRLEVKLKKKNTHEILKLCLSFSKDHNHFFFKFYSPFYFDNERQAVCKLWIFCVIIIDCTIFSKKKIPIVYKFSISLKLFLKIYLEIILYLCDVL